MPLAVLEDQATAQGQDVGPAQQQQEEDEDRWYESIHRWFDYPLPFPRMLREALVRLRLGHAWVTYVGTRYRHRIYQEEWAMAVQISILGEYGACRDIALGYALPSATTMKPPSVMQLMKPWQPYATLVTAC